MNKYENKGMEDVNMQYILNILNSNVRYSNIAMFSLVIF